MHKGIYLSRLAVIGPDKKNAEVSFDKGLNVVSGASNTGKSYVFECIDFVLGSRESPKPIGESEGYKQVRLELKTFDGKVFTLNRQFEDNQIYLAETSFEGFEKSEPRKLSAKHDSINDNNLSAYLLDILGLRGKKLKTNKYNDTREISFRELVRFCLVSEVKIIDSGSPIYTGQKTQETTNKSLFKLLLTGKDDDDLEHIQNPEIMKSRTKGKIELIEEKLKTKDKLLGETKLKVDKLSKDKINIQIEQLVDIVNQAQNKISLEETKRNKVWEEVIANRSKIAQIKALENRFGLLNKHYESDMARLEFINEGKQYIDQIEQVNCPLCDNLIDKKILEPYEDGNEKVVESIKGEFSKIKEKQKELLDTIEELDSEKNQIGEELSKKEKEAERINAVIANKLKPLHETNSAQLQKFLEFRNEKFEVQIIEDEIKGLKTELQYYKNKLDEKQQRGVERVLPESIYHELSQEIKKIIVDWGVQCKEVYYNPSENDIEVDGEKRRNFGKGYRAIYLSAFMLGVLFFCLKKGQKHPFFLILDSPLTTYKARDKDKEEKKRVSESVQNKFYSSILELSKINDVQIIVIDNKDPPEEVKDKVAYTHFSKNNSAGRYGFYPIGDK